MYMWSVAAFVQSQKFLISAVFEENIHGDVINFPLNVLSFPITGMNFCFEKGNINSPCSFIFTAAN